MMRLYYDPDCSKCREARRLLEQAGQQPTIVDYRERPLSAADLAGLLDHLDVEPDALVRRHDPGADQWIAPDEPVLDRNRVIEILAIEPGLMQRPLLEVDKRALIARPPERVFELVPGSSDGA